MSDQSENRDSGSRALLEKNGSTHEAHEACLREELLHHFPYAVFSVAIGFVVLALVSVIGLGLTADAQVMRSGYHVLFHSFHYLHLVFAVTGTCITFLRFSSSLLRCIAVSLLAPALFCTLSDVALPALVGQLLGGEMDVHICFFSPRDLLNTLPFMGAGLLAGFSIAGHYRPFLNIVSMGAHFAHILISSLAAIFYMVSNGFEEWFTMMGPLFFLLILAVVVPCTISDVIVPMYFARRSCECDERH